MPSPSASRKRKEPSSPTETNSNTTNDAKLASGLYKELQGGELRKLCTVGGCGNFVQQGGVCTTHGAKRFIYTCSHEGCENQVRQGGVCTRHGAKQVKRRICSHEGCESQARKGGVCMRHGAEVNIKTCSYEGCTNQVQNSGVCIMHGAKRVRKTCSHEGCTTYARGSKGVCIRHGANEVPKKKRKSSAVVSDNEDDANNNQKRQTTRRRIKPPATTTEAQNNGSIGSEVNLDHAAGTNNDTEESEMSESFLDNGTDQSANSIINDNTDSVGEENLISYVGDDDRGGDVNDIDYDQDTVTTNEQQQSNVLSHLATDTSNYLCVVIDDNNERNEMEKR